VNRTITRLPPEERWAGDGVIYGLRL